MRAVRVGIIGGAGYTGGELLRILLNHPQVEIVFIHSNSHAGKKIYEAHTDLFGETGLLFPINWITLLMCFSFAWDMESRLSSWIKMQFPNTSV
jgi:hypothetical protein